MRTHCQFGTIKFTNRRLNYRKGRKFYKSFNLEWQAPERDIYGAKGDVEGNHMITTLDLLLH